MDHGPFSHSLLSTSKSSNGIPSKKGHEQRERLTPWSMLPPRHGSVLKLLGYSVAVLLVGLCYTLQAWGILHFNWKKKMLVAKHEDVDLDEHPTHFDSG